MSGQPWETHDPLCPNRRPAIAFPNSACSGCRAVVAARAEGYAAALDAARDAVAALPWKVAVSFGPIDCDRSCEHGPCVCSGVMRPEAWLTGPADALAAIDGVCPCGGVGSGCRCEKEKP